MGQPTPYVFLFVGREMLAAGHYGGPSSVYTAVVEVHFSSSVSNSRVRQIEKLFYATVSALAISTLVQRELTVSALEPIELTGARALACSFTSKFITALQTHRDALVAALHKTFGGALMRAADTDRHGWVSLRPVNELGGEAWTWPVRPRVAPIVREMHEATEEEIS